jgi:hypothetical protein
MGEKIGSALSSVNEKIEANTRKEDLD